MSLRLYVKNKQFFVNGFFCTHRFRFTSACPPPSICDRTASSVLRLPAQVLVPFPQEAVGVLRLRYLQTTVILSAFEKPHVKIFTQYSAERNCFSIKHTSDVA